jgi:hypothetical protein
MWSDTKIAAIAGVAAVMATAAGYGVYSLIGDSVDSKSPKATATKPSPVKTGPPSAAEVQTIAHRFLTAWEAGDPAKAASLTDDREEAEVALTGYHKDAHITEAKLEPGKPTGSTVPFNVDATISYRGQKTPWTYGSKLKVVRDRKTGRALVDWQPSVVYPELRPGDSLKTGETEAPPIKAVDRNGTALSPKDHPALRGVFASLRKRYGAKAGGTASVELWIDRAKNKGGSADSGKDAKQPDQTLKVLSKGKPGTLRTTLDARLQGIAEQAVSKRPKAAVVAVKPSTGEILAVANSPAEGYNTAFQGSLAPGSTMKIITSALLLEKGLASYGEEHPCPKYATYGGWKFHNVDKFEIENGTFAQSFAASCNTAFITQAGKISDDALTKEAREVFGIGLNWQAGVPTFDGRVPVQTAAPKAASLIGQGGVRMNPLTMASASTTGSSRRPPTPCPRGWWSNCGS